MTLSNVYPVVLVQSQYEQTYLAVDGTDQSFPGGLPGDISQDNQGGNWMLVKAGSAIAQYDLCTITDAAIPIAASATTTTIAGPPGMLGIAQVAIASGSYGWLWRGPGGGVGRGIKCNLAASCAADVLLFTTATPGVVDDAPVDESVVSGLRSTATITTAAAAEVLATTFLTCNLGEVD